jgi:hypothetical protein
MVEMARPNSKSVKEKLLLGFVLVALAMVGLIWADGLSGRPDPTPAYYRGHFQVDEDAALTLTSEATQYQLNLTTTPLATRAHRNDPSRHETPTPGAP